MKTDGACQFGFSKLSEKDIKSLKILELIIKKGIISRTEIARTTGINIVSISNYINKYIEDKLITEKGFDVSTGGRKPELVELNNDDNRVIGVDIGKDHICVVLTNIGLEVIKKTHLPNTGNDPNKITEELCGSIEEIIKTSALPPAGIKAVCVGADPEDYPRIGKEIKERFGVGAFVGDRSSCAAFGERSLNKNIPPGDMLYIHSDAGCGIVAKEDGNRISSSDSKYLSPWKESLGIVNLAKSDVARGVGTSIVELAKGSMANINENVIIDAAKQNDEVALSIMRSVGMSLGLRIAYLVNLFSPKSIVIGGGIEQAGSFILEPIRKMVRKMSLKGYSDTVVLIPGVLGEEAVSLGAASLAAREIFLKG